MTKRFCGHESRSSRGASEREFCYAHRSVISPSVAASAQDDIRRASDVPSAGLQHRTAELPSSIGDGFCGGQTPPGTHLTYHRQLDPLLGSLGTVRFRG